MVVESISMILFCSAARLDFLVVADAAREDDREKCDGGDRGEHANADGEVVLDGVEQLLEAGGVDVGVVVVRVDLANGLSPPALTYWSGRSTPSRSTGCRRLRT